MVRILCLSAVVRMRSTTVLMLVQTILMPMTEAGSAYCAYVCCYVQKVITTMILVRVIVCWGELLFELGHSKP